MRAYYVANPTREVLNVNGINCTAVACEAAAQAISTAQSDSNRSNTDAGTAQANLFVGIAAGRRRMTGLRDELSQRIGPDDERWYAFGFEKPGDPSTPEVPENLTVTQGTMGTLLVHCDNARRADSYRFVVTEGGSGNPLADKLSDEPEAIFTGLPSGTTANIAVSARNAAGESQPCDLVVAVVP